MNRVGLTGGIASGKSTVCEMLRKRGVTILDADLLAHQVILREQPCYTRVVEAFGQEILASGGEIDRSKLGELVFEDPPKLRILNQIVHPEVIRQILAKLDIIECKGDDPRVIVDASVMIESGFHKTFQFLIVVTCRAEQQLERLMGRARLTEHQARQRIAAQIPLPEKVRLAHWVIDNSGPLEHTEAQVDRL